MIHPNFIKWVLFFSMFSTLEGRSRELWQLNDFASVEKSLKIILESCYKNDESSHPIVIFGDFNEFIDESSIIRMNNSLNLKNDGSLISKASKIVLVEDSPKTLESDLILFRETKWWDHMASFFIIRKSNKACENFEDFLNTTWTMDIINSIYICGESMNTSVLYTLNPIANYAPFPWERIQSPNDLNVFRQVFDRKILCKNLNYDKTKFLNGYEVKTVFEVEGNKNFVPHRNYFEEFANSTHVNVKLLQCIFTMLNITGRLDIHTSNETIFNKLIPGESDMTILPYALRELRRSSFLVPHFHYAMIAVVKLHPEITTLQKILKLWSPPVLIAAAIALAFLTLILAIRNYNFVLGILDLVRLLTYTSIHTNDRSHSFRIYFSTMLIFMVISNGVFQGKIAAFLTKQERTKPSGTINSLADLGYEIHAVEHYWKWYNEICPECNFKSASDEKCIEYALNNTLNLCVIWENEYYYKFSHLSLDHIHEAVEENFGSFAHRKNWPLKDRLNDVLLRIVQSGIFNLWREGQVFLSTHKRKAREAEWSSAQYRLVKLYKLQFAFQALAVGLLISTIVFVVELHNGNHETTQ